MAEIYIDSDINVNGKIKAATVPNATGTVITYNSTTKEFSTRTNAQIISDLGIDSGLTSYVKKVGDTMTGALNMNTGVNSTFNRDLSTLAASGGYARDLFRLMGTNGIVDALGWQGTTDSSGNITMTYGYLGSTAYNSTRALTWTSDGRVGVGLGSTTLPSTGYSFDNVGNLLSRGSINTWQVFNASSGELTLQRQGSTRIRTNTASIILSGLGDTGIVYVRPQGDSVTTSQVLFNANNTVQYPDNYNMLIGAQLVSGSNLFQTNVSGTAIGYGLWMGQNLQFNGTDFIQPRGNLASWGFSVNNHKRFSFNWGANTGTNGSIVPLTEVAGISNVGVITTLSTGSSTDWNSAVTNGFLYKGNVPSVDLNTIVTSGWYVQPLNVNATLINNYPVASVAGTLKVFGGNATHMSQEYHTYANNNDVYRRYYFSGAWSPWAKLWDTNDFSSIDIASWNFIALNGATQPWVDLYYMNKSSQNVIKDTSWFITSDFTTGMEDKITFRSGILSLEWDQSRMQLGKNGTIDLVKYGIKQDDPLYPNVFYGNTRFKNVTFENAQGIAPFTVSSSTVVPQLNADLLDGRHASDFVTAPQLDGYISKSPLIFRSIPDANSATGTDFYYLNGLNKPNGVNDGSLQSYNYDNSLWSSQMFTDWRTNEWYGRVKSNGSWSGWQKFWHDGNLNPSAFVSTSRKITINGVTQDLSVDRTWTTPNTTYTAGAGLTLTGTVFSLPVDQLGPVGNAVTGVVQTATGLQITKGNFSTTDTVTRIKGGTGAFVAGDITIAAGANTTVNQVGTTITIASTGAAYTAGSGLTLSGTQFSLPVTSVGSGNAVSSVSQTSTGLTVVYGDYMMTSHAANSITTTNISNWNTAYTQAHTHSNKPELDVINQQLATYSTPTFGGVQSTSPFGGLFVDDGSFVGFSDDIVNQGGLISLNPYVDVITSPITYTLATKAKLVYLTYTGTGGATIDVVGALKGQRIYIANLGGDEVLHCNLGGDIGLRKMRTLFYDGTGWIQVNSKDTDCNYV